MEIIQALLIQCNSPQHEIRSQAEQTILKMRYENKNSFLQALFLFLQNNDHSSTYLDNLALILTYQTIPFSSSNIFNEFDPEIIKNLLVISSSFFSSEDCSLRSSAATVFSNIMLNDQTSGNEFQTLQFFHHLFTNPISPLIIHPLNIIISDYCYYCKVESNFILSILSSLSVFFQIQSPEIDCYCLEIISILIPMMGEIISNEITKLFPLILNYCQSIQTKANAFECLSLLVTHYYPFLDKFVPILTSKEFINLIISDNLINDEDTMNSYLSIWKNISKIENDYENDIQHFCIIQNSLLDLFPIILKIASSSQFEISNSDVNESSIQANQVLNNICELCIDQVKPMLQSFITQFHKSESFGERETTLSCVFFLIQYLNEKFNDDDINNYFILIMNGLNDPVPRVRKNGVYCAELFCDIYGCEKDQSIELMKNVIFKIANDEYVADDAASVVGTFFSINNFPFFEDSMIALISLSSSLELERSEIAFKSLSKYVKYSDIPKLQKLLDLLLQPLENSSIFSEFHLYKLIKLLTELIYKLKDQIDDKFDQIWRILTTGASKYPFQFVLPISSMARSCQVKFSPFLPSTLDLINNVLNTENFELGCTALKIIIKSVNLTDFIPLVASLLESLINVLRNDDFSASNKRMVIEVFDTINKEIHPLFDSIMNTVLPMIASLSLQLDDWEDFDSNFAYLRFFNGILMNDEIHKDVKLVVCNSIMHIMKLVINCPKMDIYYIDSVVDALFFSCRQFPDLMNMFYQKNSALEMTLNYCLENEDDDEYLMKIGAVIDILLS
ncbi:hypothetical protein M9Y10_012630 [Tritrichomonas musculus]|uniref:Importin subunit beta-1/Transportin-1-like TPR repeats domain-containing protein n=1 Tax=Tritrichomonas musculus TaxID=1915356 RepID=A0ABR2IE24_9EUKA